MIITFVKAMLDLSSRRSMWNIIPNIIVSFEPKITIFIFLEL